MHLDPNKLSLTILSLSCAHMLATSMTVASSWNFKPTGDAEFLEERF